MFYKESMPIAPVNEHSHGKEFYNTDVDFRISVYKGRVYFINSSCGASAYLCSSNLEGNNIKIIAKLTDDFEFTYIHVNITGIYLYNLWDGDRLLAQHITFDGKLLSECREEYHGGCEDDHRVSNVYIYDDKIYFVHEDSTGDDSKCQIKCMHVDAGEIEVLYDKAASIEKLYADASQLIFRARYENKKSYYSREEGWMLLDLRRKRVECISNPYCSPENVIDNPDVYDPESHQYNENCNYDRNIVFFDLNRGIFWTERRANGGTARYWEPKSLSGKQDELIPDMPVWKMLDDSSYSRREYFDGTYHYYSKHYVRFQSSNQYGDVFDWSANNSMHGRCNDFKVMGGYLFLDIAAYGEEQYPLSVAAGMAIRKSWFKDELPQDVINSYNSGYGAISDKKLPKATKNMVSEKESAGHDLSVEKTIGQTDIKYNICTFGSKFHIGFGVPVTIIMNGNTYQCKTHNTVKGRIDGTKKLYSENGIGLGDVLKATYIADSHEILLKKIE